MPLAPARPAGAAAGLSGGEIIGILRSRLVMIVLLWLLLSAVLSGAFFYFWFVSPAYTAEAFVECITDIPQMSLTLVPERPEHEEYERFVTTQSMLVKNPVVLQRALEAADVKATTWYQETPSEDRFTVLTEELISAPQKGTNFIRIAMGTKSQNDPQRVVSAVVQSYLQWTKDRARDEFRTEAQENREEEASVRAQLAEKRRQIEEFVATLPPGEAAGGQSIVTGTLLAATNLVNELTNQLRELETYASIYLNPQGVAATAQDRQMVEADPIVQALSGSVFTLQQQREALIRTGLLPGHREVKMIDAQVSTASEQLAVRRESRLTEILEDNRDMVRNAYLAKQNELLLAREQLVEAQASQADLDRKAQEYGALESEYTSLEETVEAISDYVQELNRIIKAQDTVRVSLAQAPIKPEERSFPQVFMLPIVVVLAMGLAVGLAFLLEFMDTSVRTPADVVKHLNVAMLGVVPDVDDEEIAIEQVEMATRDAPQSMIAEAFRNIRTNLHFSAPAERQRTIVVTSPRPEDGKTTVAANLAVSLGQAGRRVLLVDANLRRPALQRFFAREDGKGLSNYLVGDIDFASAVKTTSSNNVDVILSGPIPPNPAELLGSRRLTELVEEAKKRYDQIVFDAPPAPLASDPLVLGTVSDGVILVCRAGENSRGLAQRVLGLLSRVNAHLFGVVLNAAQVRRGGYFREQLRTFYDYQSESRLGFDKAPALPGEEGGKA